MQKTIDTTIGFERLRTWSRRLLVTYLAFITLFGSSAAMAASSVTHTTVLAGFAVCALLALPLFIINIVVHHIIQSIQPSAGSVGLKQLVVSIVFFTAIEAAVILPIINLIVSGRLIRAQAASPPPRKPL